MDKVMMQELNEQVMSGVVAVGIVGLTFLLFCYGLAVRF